MAEMWHNPPLISRPVKECARVWMRTVAVPHARSRRLFVWEEYPVVENL
jgi:hypothetical protein